MVGPTPPQVFERISLPKLNFVLKTRKLAKILGQITRKKGSHTHTAHTRSEKLFSSGRVCVCGADPLLLAAHSSFSHFSSDLQTNEKAEQKDESFLLPPQLQQNEKMKKK